MEATLPGSNSGKSLSQGALKAGLRLVGGADLADAIADLTGINRKTIGKLTERAAAQLAGRSSSEYRDLGGADSEAAEALVADVFTRAASATKLGDRQALMVAALKSPETLVRHVIKDQATEQIASWSQDGQAYFRELVALVVTLTVQWYFDEPNARDHAVAAGMAQNLRDQAIMVGLLGAIKNDLAAPALSNGKSLRGDAPADNTDYLEVVNIDGQVPHVRTVDPYRLGVTPSDYGAIHDHGARDIYVPRTHLSVDSRLRTQLRSNTFVVLVGPSKCGKTRSAVEAVMHVAAEAKLVVPRPGRLEDALTAVNVELTDAQMVLWLDDLERHLLFIAAAYGSSRRCSTGGRSMAGVQLTQEVRRWPSLS